jgi:hypothetical protein
MALAVGTCVPSYKGWIEEERIAVQRMLCGGFGALGVGVGIKIPNNNNSHLFLLA